MNYFKKLYTSFRHRRNREVLLSSLGFGGHASHFYLVSYPKSGNTWVRFLFANLLNETEDTVTLKTVGDYVPDIHLAGQRENITCPGSLFQKLPFKFVKTHDEYLSCYKDKKVVYIVRDGRDTLNSYFHYLNARRDVPVTIRDLIYGRTGADAANWSEHVLGWKKGQCCQKLIIRYEDLMSDAQAQVRKMLDFAGWAADDVKIAQAIENASFDKLKKIEERFGGANEQRTDSGKQTPFFRKGKTSDWMNSFSESDIAEFWKVHRKGMLEFGYDR